MCAPLIAEQARPLQLALSSQRRNTALPLLVALLRPHALGLIATLVLPAGEGARPCLPRQVRHRIKVLGVDPTGDLADAEPLYRIPRDRPE